jgi:PIN domain nuclease of toxin-antitoxin system
MLLLDTHVFLWLQTEPERLGRHLDLVEQPETDLLLSAASSWEITIKHGLGKLALPEPPQDYVPERIRLGGLIGLPIEHAHALAVSSLPPLHRDPFDRLIVAQATVLDVPVLTADPAIRQYEIETIQI